MPTLDELMRAADAGDGAAAGELFAVLYQDLHAEAEYQLRRNGGQMTLGTTTLLHETYLKLAGRQDARFPDRARFLAYASKALRGLVVDYARARRAKKRGGEFEITRLTDDAAPAELPPHDDRLERLAGAVERLAELDPDLAELVDLHAFAGFTLAELAAMRGCSERTLQRSWRKARMALRRLAEEA